MAAAAGLTRHRRIHPPLMYRLRDPLRARSMKARRACAAVTEFFVVSTALREMRAVGFAQRADQRIAVLFASRRS
jgi:hypothetical protein